MSDVTVEAEAVSGRAAKLVTFLESCEAMKARLVEEVAMTSAEFDEIEELRQLVMSTSEPPEYGYSTT